MLDNATHSALIVALLPIVAVVGLSLNLFIRARGGRAFSMRLKGFGIDLKIDTSPVIDKREIMKDGEA